MTAATYDGNGLRASATTGSGTQNFAWDGSRLLMDSSNAYIYVGGNTPAEQVSLSTGALSYLSADTLGSVRGIVSPSGSLTASTSYDAWGNPLTTGGLTSHTPFGYAGGYTDPTGLIYLINRYYDPGTGQFLSVDAAVSQTGQPYAYAGGNPVNATDPNGLWQFAIPSGQNPALGEFAFQKWVGVMLGLGTLTSEEFYLDFQGGGIASRRIDLYFSDSANFGFLNELKVGRQRFTVFNESEYFRDRLILASPYAVCHPHDNISGHRPCNRVPINGDNWWFRYRTGSTCQMNLVTTIGGNICPDYNLHNALLSGSGPLGQINIVYVFYDNKKRDTDYFHNIYAKRRAKIRNALESNACPNSGIDSAKLLPTIKFPGFGCPQ
jgi:RHS repeat-associated protein